MSRCYDCNVREESDVFHNHVCLYIDNRERKTIDFFKEPIVTTELQHSIHTKNLEIGDFIYMVNGKDIKIIERKTVTDLYASIIDGRYKEQKNRLQSHYTTSQIIYLIEGFEGFQSSTTNPKEYKMIHTSIINMIMKDSINVVFTKNMQETNHFLLEVLKKIHENPSKYQSNTNENNYSVKSSSTYYINMKKKKPSKSECFKSMLIQIPNVSITTANGLVNHFSTLENFMKTMWNITNYDDRINTISNIKLKTQKIGNKKAAQIINMLI